MKSVYPGLGPSQFQTAIASGKITVDLAQNGETMKDPEFGYGRIDALEAVEWAVKAEQGQETDAFLTSSASALDFSSNQQSLDLIIEQAGTGSLAVSDIGWTESWTSVASISIDQNGFGRYRVMVDRSGLIGGQYSGWVVFDADNGTRLWVSVLMRVGDAVQGNAAYVYALLLDQWTLQNVKTWHGQQINTGFDFDFNNLPPGTNYLMVSTDLDHDFTVCDDGELCELYPSNSEISGIVIANSDIQLGTFRMGFPTPDLKSAGDNGNAVLNSMDDNASVNSANQGPGKIVATRPRE
jgi:serine protease